MNISRHRSPGTESGLSQWEPFRTMRDILRFDPFQESLRHEPLREAAAYPSDWVPDVDVKETPKELVFKVDLPGMKDDDIECNVTGNRLTITGKRQEERKIETETYYAMERAVGTFTRSFILPDGADFDNVKADLTNGVLTIVVPKKTEGQSRRVSVKSGGGILSEVKAALTGQSSPSGGSSKS